MNFKFKALLSYTKTTKCVKFQGVWCTGVTVGVFRISPILFIGYHFLNTIYSVLMVFEIILSTLAILFRYLTGL